MVCDGILYVGTIESKVIALDAEDGDKLDWEKEIKGQSSGGFGCSSYISTPMSTYGAPVVKDGVVYIGGYDGNVYAFATEGGMSNEFETGGAIVGSPVIDDETNTIFVGSSDGKLYALNLDLSPKWKEPFETGDKIWSTPAVDNGVVYIGSADHRLYALDADTGEEIWYFEAEAGILSTPLVYEGTIYIGACDNKFYAIDVEQEGKEATAKGIFDEAGNWFWTEALAYNGKIYVGNLDHKLYVLDAQNIETKLDEFETEGRIRTQPVFVGGSIVIGSEDGNIYKLNPEDLNNNPIPILLEAPILAPIYPDTENGVIYVHAQNGTHTLYAINVETENEIWNYPTE